MSYATFVPKLWAAKILKNLNNAHVFKALGTTEFQEPLQNMGNSIVINSVSQPTIKDYDRNSPIDTPEYLTGTEQTIDIDQEKYYNFLIPDIDEVQSKPALMSSYTEEASWALADVMDRFYASLLHDGVATGNQLTKISAGTAANDDNLYETIVDLNVALDETNTPGSGRWCVMSPKLMGLLYKDDRFVSFGTSENRSTIRGAAIGQVLDMKIHVSNNLPTDGSGDPVMIAGYKGAFACVDQMKSLEAFKPENQFGDALKELHVYGAKVIRPDNMARVAVSFA